jgi:hypothetical protein
MKRQLQAVLVGVTEGTNQRDGAGDAVDQLGALLSCRFTGAGTVRSLTGPDASRGGVLAAIAAALAACRSGDLFVLLFSGHGDSPHGGEVWQLNDDTLSDGELAGLLRPFNDNSVEVFVVSDCCYGRGMRRPGPGVTALTRACSSASELVWTFARRSRRLVRRRLQSSLDRWTEKLLESRDKVEAAEMVLAASAVDGGVPSRLNTFVRELCASTNVSAKYRDVRNNMAPHDAPWTVDGNPEALLELAPLAR